MILIKHKPALTFQGSTFCLLLEQISAQKSIRQTTILAETAESLHSCAPSRYLLPFTPFCPVSTALLPRAVPYVIQEKSQSCAAYPPTLVLFLLLEHPRTVEGEHCFSVASSQIKLGPGTKTRYLIPTHIKHLVARR